MTHRQPAVQERRKNIEPFPGGAKRVFDPATGNHVVKIFSGDWYVSNEPNEMLVTILGS